MIREVRDRKKKLVEGFTSISLRIVILTIIFSGAFVAFIFIAEMIFKDHASSFDVRVFNFLSGFVTDVNTRVMEFFTFSGSHKFLIPANILLLAYFLFLKKQRWHSISIIVVSLSSLLLMFFLKYIFHRDRPLSPLLKAHGYSFPSGHALMSFTFYGLLIYLTWLNVKNTWVKWLLTIVLALVIFAIGLSRVYLRAHFVSDVLAGYCVGCMWLLFSLWILKKVENSMRKKIDPVTPGASYSSRYKYL